MKNFNFIDLEIPVIQAPMAGGFNTPELASSVSNLGGVGSFGFSFTSSEQIEKTLVLTKKLTEGYINANFFVFKPITLPDENSLKIAFNSLDSLTFSENFDLITPKEPFYFPLEEQIQATLLHLPSIITFHLGIPPLSILDNIKSYGVKVGITATNLKEATLIQKSGADFIVLQGMEAGGHRGIFDQDELDEELNLDSLIETVSDEIKIPYVAAGGIMNGEDIKRVLKLGAKAAQLGTAFLCCNEAGTPSIHKNYLLNKQNRKTKLTKAFSGRLARGIINKFMLEMENKNILPFPVQNTLTTPLRKVSANNNNGEFINLWAGKNFNKIRSLNANELMENLKNEIKN